jgi:hypothetical protein
MGGACGTSGEKRNAYRLLVGKRPLGRRRRKWVDNIRMGLRDVDWIVLTQDREMWRAL